MLEYETITYEQYLDLLDKEIDYKLEQVSDYYFGDIMPFSEACECFGIYEEATKNSTLAISMTKKYIQLRKQKRQVNTAIRFKRYNEAEKQLDEMVKSIFDLKKALHDADTSLQSDIMLKSISIYSDICTMTAITDQIIDKQCDTVITSKGEWIHPKDQDKAAAIAGIGLGVVALKDIGLPAYKKLRGYETNQIKIWYDKMLNHTLKCCKQLKNKLNRKRKFDAFVKANHKKIAITGAVVGVGVGAVAAKKAITKQKKEITVKK